MLPLEAGIGAVPLCRANAAGLRNRVMIEPMPAAIDQEQLAGDLVERARAEGVKLTGPDEHPGPSTCSWLRLGAHMSSIFRGPFLTWPSSV